ncbi:hypothetical protein FNF31_01776 [Cafeteria roenbergensis]|uniref:Thioredoxin-like fold domain-containing protein n=1 Tax=Cafeteria roenbergensis TaxID=33653 RepID=A0A5A8DKZ1_CAFRO|nr:hypothetical protein FNF31_01776 [Cafeteria roenbergensis]
MASEPLNDKELDRLAAFGTILFGRKSGCDETATMRAMLRVPSEGGASAAADGTAREDGPFFIACDGSEEEQSVCKQAGITETPVTVVAGVGYLGAQSAKAIRAAIALPDFVSEGLKRAEATLYGSESCSWTVRQKTVFGPAFETVNYVECNREPGKCSAAGVSSVPAWHLAKAGPDGTPRKLVGFQPLPALLQATASRFSEAELKEFTERD